MRRKLHKQQRANTCAVASLRTVLDLQYDLKVAEEALSILGTDPYTPIKKYGTGTTQLRQIVKRASQALNAAAPWRLAVKCHGTVADLERELAAGCYPMVSVHEPNPTTDYHMIVVLEVDIERVQVWDPDPETPRSPKWMDLPQFLAWWSGGDAEMTWYAVVRGAYHPAVEVDNGARGQVAVGGVAAGRVRIPRVSGDVGPREVLDDGALVLCDRGAVCP